MPKTSNVSIKVFDVIGKEVATLVNETKSAGINSVEFNGSKLVSGIYIYRLQAGDITLTKKLTLIK